MVRGLFARRGTAVAYAVLALGIIGMISFCIFGIALNMPDQAFTAEAAAWAQAAGSIAAIAGAIWLSRMESGRDRRQRRLDREEAAWAVRFAIVGARNEAYTVAHELVDPAQALASENGRHWRTRCRNVRLLLQSYAARADHIHPAIAQDANNAMLLAEEMEADVERAAAYMIAGKLPSLKIAQDLAWYEIQFTTLIQRIDERMIGIRGALDRGGDMLPHDEFQWNTNYRLQTGR